MNLFKSIFKFVNKTIGIVPAIIIIAVIAGIAFFSWLRREKEVKNMMDKYDIGNSEDRNFSIRKTVKDGLEKIKDNME
jgi:hypothetical protein